MPLNNIKMSGCFKTQKLKKNVVVNIYSHSPEETEVEEWRF